MKEFLIGIMSGLLLMILACVFLLSECATTEPEADDPDNVPLKIVVNADGDILISAKDFERMEALFLYEKSQAYIGNVWKQKYENTMRCVAENERMHFNVKQCFEDKI